LHASQATTNEKIEALRRQIASIDSAEHIRLENALATKRQEHVVQRLTWFDIRTAVLEGIGPALKERLYGSGIRTAADVPLLKRMYVPGIGASRSSGLWSWYNHKRQQAEASAPSQLSPYELASITEAYQRQRARPQGEMADLERAHTSRDDDIRSRHMAKRSQLEREKQAIHASIAQARGQLHQQFAAKRDTLARDRDLAHQAHLGEMKALSEQITMVQKSILAQEWQRAKVVRQMAAYANIRFGLYVRRVVLARTKT